MIAGPIFCSKMSRAARSGTLSPNGFQLVWARPEPVKPTRSYSTGKRRLPPLSSYCGGSHTPSLRTCGSPSRLFLRIFETCSSTTSVPDGPLGRLMVMVSRIVVGRDRGEVRLWQPGQPAEIDVRLSARRAPFNRDPSTRLRRVGQTLRRCGLDL